MRGERDYTQRVVATIRPAGIVGGRTIVMEDFEALIMHTLDQDAGVSTTTTEGEVFEGDASGKITCGGVADQVFYSLSFPPPTQDVLTAEVVWKPIDHNLDSARLEFLIYDGAQYTEATVKLDLSGSVAVLQILDSTNAWKIVKSYLQVATPYAWHLLYMRINYKTRKYELVQFDNARIPLKDEGLYVTADLQLPYALVRFDCWRKGYLTTEVVFDNLIAAYEEL